jgi:hypothetical protein
MRVTGSCLCGAVSIHANVTNSVGACHCDICRTWGGGPLFALDGGIDVVITGGQNVSTFPTTAWAQRAFCDKCGTHLFIKVNQSGRYILPAGLFDIDSGLEFDHQIFVDKRPAYYCFANDTREQTGAEVFAEFAARPSE